MLEIELMALSFLGKSSTTELNPQPLTNHFCDPEIYDDFSTPSSQRSILKHTSPGCSLLQFWRCSHILLAESSVPQICPPQIPETSLGLWNF